jgi:hypothetical protein
MMVSEPPFSTLRAAPKIDLGSVSARMSSPPDMIRPPPRMAALNARPSRVSESSRMNTSCPLSTIRLAFSVISRAMRTWLAMS